MATVANQDINIFVEVPPARRGDFHRPVSKQGDNFAVALAPRGAGVIEPVAQVCLIGRWHRGKPGVEVACASPHVGDHFADHLIFVAEVGVKGRARDSRGLQDIFDRHRVNATPGQHLPGGGDNRQPRTKLARGKAGGGGSRGHSGSYPQSDDPG